MKLSTNKDNQPLLIQFLKYLRTSEALGVRLLYVAHATFAVTITAQLTENHYLFFFYILTIVSAIEFVYTLKKSKEGEWKWVSPSVLVYLLWIVPQIAILEEKAREERLLYLNSTDKVTPTLPDITNHRKDTFMLLSGTNNTFSQFITNPEKNKEYGELGGISRFWSTMLEQSMMLVFVLGRWLSPKGPLTREQLSQLLLGYYGMAADMLEFISETTKLANVTKQPALFRVIIVVWAWSLLQFPLNLTNTKRKKRRSFKVFLVEQQSWSTVETCSELFVCCFGGEIFAILVSVIFQDGVFFIVRLYIIIFLEEASKVETMYFFLCKNGIIFIIQIYRLLIVLGVISKKNIDAPDTPDALDSEAHVQSADSRDRSSDDDTLKHRKNRKKVFNFDLDISDEKPDDKKKDSKESDPRAQHGDWDFEEMHLMDGKTSSPTDDLGKDIFLSVPLAGEDQSSTLLESHVSMV